MRIQPRQHLLEVWRATARSSLQDGRWIWGGRSHRNSVSDAEQLLCLMEPATKISSLRLDLPNETAEDVLDALARLGDSVEIPRRLITVMADYLATYADETGAPVFSGGSYFATNVQQEPTSAQRDLDVVDAFAVSVRLSLAIVGFAKIFRRVLTRKDLLHELDTVETVASHRLTAALIGLLRSFSVYVFDVDSPEGRDLCRTINQNQLTNQRVVDELHRQVREVKAGLRDLTMGIAAVVDLDNDNKLFECGWSWGVSKGAPPVETTAERIRQPDGVAQAAPYLYFTVVALDCIQNLMSERTRLLGLLDEEQQRLTRALQIRWDLTQSYWSRIARLGDARWPLEDMPWRTTDGTESDYYTLLVSSIVVQDLSNRPAPEPAPETEAYRVASVLRELAERARITRRGVVDDPAVFLHAPGFALELEGSEDLGGPRLTWLLGDFSPQLLRQTIRVAALLRDTERRGEVAALADRVWEDHLLKRRLTRGLATKLWDQPAEVYREVTAYHDAPSWYYTERVVGCLVVAANHVAAPPLRSPRLIEVAADLLAEADHIFDRELLRMSAEAGPAMGNALQKARRTLRRAHEIIRARPGTAVALVLQALHELDILDAARRSASRSG